MSLRSGFKLSDYQIEAFNREGSSLYVRQQTNMFEILAFDSDRGTGSVITLKIKYAGGGDPGDLDNAPSAQVPVTAGRAVGADPEGCLEWIDDSTRLNCKLMPFEPGEATSRQDRLVRTSYLLNLRRFGAGGGVGDKLTPVPDDTSTIINTVPVPVEMQ